MIVPFFIYSIVDNTLLAGVVPTHSYFKRRNADTTFTNLTATISDTGGGRYEFTIPDSDFTAGSTIDYVIDCTAASASRYLEGHLDSDEVVAEESEEVGDGIVTFGVTASTVRQSHFPHWTDFSTSSNPTADTVTTLIEEEAADLAGQLAMQQITASDIEQESAARAWCQKTLKIAVAIRVLQVSTAQDPELAKTLQAQLTKRYDLLDKFGATAIGPGASADDSGSPPQGPTTHISEGNLDTGGWADASSVVPRLRRDDEL